MSGDYAALGLKVGLEIHRQLDTGHKLFCECPTILSTRPATLTFTRKLRPTQSELGQVDPAALFEFHKGRQIVYESDQETNCLVELDEEPPHPLNGEAVDLALTIGRLLAARPLDEIHVMRKVVIDGSNTTGFQRTVVVALNGKVQVDGKEVPLEQVTLEEDAGRKMGETKNSVTFRLDRLGVPLIEISTGPVITSPEEAERAALAIGRILRATRRVKRGLGSIRQDLNVSIRNGALVEIKGVQELDLVAKVVALEAQRQQALIGIREELHHRNVREADLKEDFIDVSSILSDSPSKIVQAALKQNGEASAVRLAGFRGLFKRELVPGIRLGTEMAKRAGFWGKVGGIFHSDELPAYGIGQAHVEAVSRILSCGESDGFVIVADQKANVQDALRAVVDRAREAVQKVPEETRVANPDGTTHYMRPRPGAARMYPETDVPPVSISPERLRKIDDNLPRMPEEIARELELKYGISGKLAGQLVDSDYLPVFEGITAEFRDIAPSYTATVLTESLKSLAREKVPVENLQEQHVKQVFGLVSEGATAKESVVDILKWLASRPESTPREALKELRLEMLARSDLESIIDRVVTAQQALVSAQGSKAIGKIMNLVMGEVRGKANPGEVNELLKARLQQVAS